MQNSYLKYLAVAAVCLPLFSAEAQAYGRIVIGSGGYYAPVAPVYYYPDAPVYYTAPAPVVYAPQPAVVYAPQPVYVAADPVYYAPPLVFPLLGSIRFRWR